MKKTVVRFILGIFVILAWVIGAMALLAKPNPGHPFFDTQGIQVIAHRGGRHLWPENTLFAFENASTLGVDVLEMDLHSTRDGAIVVIHDSTVDRTTDGTGLVQSYTLAELQSLDAGYRWSPDGGETHPYRGQDIVIPTLEAVLVAFPEILLNLEIKQSDPSVVVPLCKLLREYGAVERVLVASFDTNTIKAFRKNCPEVPTSSGEDEIRLLYGLSRVFLAGVYSPKAEAVQVPEYSGKIQVMTKRFVDAAHGRGMAVHVWTVNEVADMERMLELGVDGIITDAPDLLLDLLGR
jgi:glycerophosphoryl diester phosphodiesterase